MFSPPLSDQVGRPAPALKAGGPARHATFGRAVIARGGCVVAALAVLFTSAPPAIAVDDPIKASDVRLRMRTAKTDCGAASYAWVGRGRGRPLLMLNGTGSPASEWDPALLAHLGRNRRLLVFDYPGLGGSMSLPRVSFNILARCAAKLARKVHDGPIDVLGWSMGGFVAQRMAVQSPKLVRKLVLVGTNPGGRAAVLGPKWVQREDSNPGPALKAYVRSNYPKGYRDLGWAFIRRLDNAAKSHRYPRARVPRKVFRAMVKAETPWLKSNRNSRDLRSLREPTLVVVGADDVVTPPANARRIAKRIRGSQLAVVPHAGHSVLFAYPAQTARMVTDFLS